MIVMQSTKQSYNFMHAFDANYARNQDYQIELIRKPSNLQLYDYMKKQRSF